MSISASSAPASASIRLSGEAVCGIAAHQGKTETQLIAEINRSRGIVGLSVAIRRYVVEFYRARIELPPRGES